MGKQSVAVTVDVQAPTSMNLNKEATLKLIVRNTGIADAFNVQVDDELGCMTVEIDSVSIDRNLSPELRAFKA